MDDLAFVALERTASDEDLAASGFLVDYSFVHFALLEAEVVGDGLLLAVSPVNQVVARVNQLMCLDCIVPMTLPQQVQIRRLCE